MFFGGSLKTTLVFVGVMILVFGMCGIAFAEGRRAAEQEERLRQKDEVIAELAEELPVLKKKIPANDGRSEEEP
jgi:CHASE3 domain sensor protein